MPGRRRHAGNLTYSYRMTSSRWHLHALRLAALSQNGLTFMQDPFDRQRWEEVRGIAAEMLAAGAATSADEMIESLSREDGYATPKVDVRAAVGFYGETGLPPLSLGRVTEAQVRRMFEHARDPSLPTDYD